MKNTNNSPDISIAANKYQLEKEFWKQKFSEFKDNYSILPDKTSEDKNYKKGSIDFKFDSEINQKLLYISNNSETRLLVLLMTGIAVFLNKFTDSDDVGFAVPIYKQKEEGDFINTILPILTGLNKGLTFKDILLKIREEHLRAVKNQNYPIKWLYDNLQETEKQIESKTGFPFNIMVLLENLQDIKYVEEPIDIIFSFNLKDNNISGKIDYNQNLFSHELVELFIEYVNNIFASGLLDLNTKLPDINILSEKGKQLLEKSMNNYYSADIEYSSLGNWFENTVKKYPNKTAIKYLDDNGEKEITYLELNEKANVLANELLNKGIKKDDFVALLFLPSIDMIVSIIAVLKTGGAYIPISFDNPSERIKYILTNSSAKCLLYSQHQFNSDISEYVNIENAIDINTINSSAINNHESINVKFDNLAYMIYTSGSTGTPKGVLVEHKGIINYTNWRLKTYDYSNRDVSLQLLSYEFDGFNSNFYSSILSGGTLILLSKKRMTDFAGISKIINEEKITNTSTIPRIFETIIDNSEVPPKYLRFIVLAGEKCDKQIISKINSKLPELKIINEYGPTESSVTIAANLDYNILNYKAIGKPIANNNIYILNNDNNMLPIGSIGEICVSGIGLARGYFNNDELTNQKFIINPFNKSEKLYKTGDLGRWLANGDIEYISRKDRQVKIRGFRIELEEIESTLLKHEMINDVFVDVKEINNNSAICAYIVSSGDHKIVKENIDSYLSEYLPYYMLPQCYMQIEEMPITSSGKLNRNALPIPKIETENEQFLKPQTEVEIKLANIWSKVLNIDSSQIGVNSNFFEIGGHSLNATILINKIHKDMGVKIPLLDLFKSPTIRELLIHFKNYEHEEFHGIPKAGIKDFYRVSLAQKRLFLTQQKDADSIAYNVPTQFIMAGEANIESLEENFTKLVERHECLRTSFYIENDEIVQRINEKIKINIERFNAGESEIEKIIEGFTRSFKLSDKSLIRFGVIHLNDVNKSILMIDMHHIITDGVSVGILMSDFMDICNNKVLPELKIQYKDFAEWQDSKEYKIYYEKQEKYWDNIFSKKIERLKLPIDDVRKNLTNPGKQIRLNIDKELNEKIFKLASDTGATVYNFVISMFSIYLSKLCKSNDIIIGSPATGRTHSDMESIVGYFVNTMVLRNEISNEQSFKEIIQNVRKNSYSAFENQDYSFESLVQKFNGNIEAGRNPIFDVFLNYNNFKFPHMEIDGVKLEVYNRITENQLKFDLSLNAVEFENKLNFSFSYNSNLFGEKTIQWIANCFTSLMNTIVSNPDLRIEEFDITGELFSDKIIHDTENPFDL